MSRVGLALLLCAAPGVALAATPSMGTMSPATTVVRYDGSAIAGGAQGDPVGILIDSEDNCVEGVSCDTFTLNVAGTPADWAGKGVHVKISWLTPAHDYDLYVHKGTIDGVEACHSGNGATTPTGPLTSEECDIDPNLTGVGQYSVHVVYWVATAADQYHGELTLTTAPAPPPPPPPEPTAAAFVARFFNYRPAEGLATTAGEPSIGVNAKTGKVMYIANTDTLRASFNDATSPAGSLWEN